MSINKTIPWKDEEAMQGLVEQWLQGGNLPPLLSLLAGVHGVVVLVMASVFFTLLRYPLWQVIGTIAIVEIPQTVFQDDRHQSKKTDDYDNDDAKVTKVITQQKHLTSSVQDSLKFLYRLEGFASFYRGTAITLCYHITRSTIHAAFLSLLSSVVPHIHKLSFSPIISFLTAILTELLLCQWSTAHTHILITPPTFRVWYRRLPPFSKTLKATWKPLIVKAIAYKITFSLPYILLRQLGVWGNRTSSLGPAASGTALYLRSFTFVAVWLVAQAARIELLVPAGVAEIRVQTSLLPEDEDTIVPVDRSFTVGGSGRQGMGSGFQAPPPGILAQARGAITFVEAWRSYTRVERKRILMLYGKYVIIEAVLRGMVWLVVGNDIWPGFWHPAP